MVSGAHILLYSEKADEDRNFFRDVLGFSSVDAGNGWLIFKLPPAELAVHPKNGETAPGHAMIAAQLYLMCEDLHATMKKLEAKLVRCTPTNTERWGIRTTIVLPSGAELGLYQPTHPTAVGIGRAKKRKPVAKKRGRKK
jgi:hypothetical protein